MPGSAAPWVVVTPHDGHASRHLYQQGRGIDPSRRELVGERPASWIREAPSTACERWRDGGEGQPVGLQATPADEAVSGIQALQLRFPYPDSSAQDPMKPLLLLALTATPPLIGTTANAHGDW
jgi:hypothetical protein